MDIAKPPSGRDIWNAVKDELTGNLYPLPFSTLAPTVYHVYLHPDDYDEIEGIVPRIVSEVTSALTREVERINRDVSRRSSRLWTRLRQDEQPTPVETPSAGWEIYIQPDRDAELSRGALGIISKLTVPAPPEYGGTPTTRIVKTVVADSGRTTVMSEVQESGTATQPTADGVRATLVYEDQQGPHTFVMRKDCIKIGRGGMGAWVDVQVITNPTVSREHCWIARDRSGCFFIQDVSTRGTTVDGEPIPPAVRSPEGAVTEAGAKKALGPDARIGLADALILHFHIGSQP